MVVGVAAVPVWPQPFRPDEGASVLIVEKMPTIGGNTIKAAGMNAAETLPAGEGIGDSKELFYS